MNESGGVIVGKDLPSTINGLLEKLGVKYDKG